MDLFVKRCAVGKPCRRREVAAARFEGDPFNTLRLEPGPSGRPACLSCSATRCPIIARRQAENERSRGCLFAGSVAPASASTCSRRRLRSLTSASHHPDGVSHPTVRIRICQPHATSRRTAGPARRRSASGSQRAGGALACKTGRPGSMRIAMSRGARRPAGDGRHFAWLSTASATRNLTIANRSSGALSAPGGAGVALMRRIVCASRFSPG
jgi:hypothetical protein